jgi:hypothetical protein
MTKCLGINYLYVLNDLFFWENYIHSMNSGRDSYSSWELTRLGGIKPALRGHSTQSVTDSYVCHLCYFTSMAKRRAVTIKINRIFVDIFEPMMVEKELSKAFWISEKK